MNSYVITITEGQPTWDEIPIFSVDNILWLPDVGIRANCYKCGDLTPKPHYLSWNPVTSPNPDFHRPQDFGLMTLA
ncbi:MAG: hypothetical protein IKW10_05250 [Oscillospiraceae bacterium]|nr:hypothetical protein [Oscillospiraceae bacterium]